MRLRVSRLLFLLVGAVALTLSAPGEAEAKKKNRDRAARDFRHIDANRDGELSLKEWNRRGNFKLLDRNGSGGISLNEMRALYDGAENRDYEWPPRTGLSRTGQIDARILADKVAVSEVRKADICGFAQHVKGCRVEDHIARGLLATNTGPVFPPGSICPGIDDTWALDYAFKRNKQVFHGGIDMPVPWGTPIRAAAAGSVVAIYDRDNSKRGIEVILRHSPEQSGLPAWTYTGYGHLDRLPDLQVGEQVALGQILGPTGNSGISSRGSKQSRNRRPAIHFSVLISPTAKYTETEGVIVPRAGNWLDPLVFYRGKPPFDSRSVKELPDAEKSVPVSVMMQGGAVWPSETKRVWPYACRRG